MEIGFGFDLNLFLYLMVRLEIGHLNRVNVALLLSGFKSLKKQPKKVLTLPFLLGWPHFTHINDFCRILSKAS